MGGLYWPRGTALGAGAALTVGAITSVGALYLQLALGTGAFPYNGNQVCLSVRAAFFLWPTYCARWADIALDPARHCWLSTYITSCMMEQVLSFASFLAMCAYIGFSLVGRSDARGQEIVLGLQHKAATATATCSSAPPTSDMGATHTPNSSSRGRQSSSAQFELQAPYLIQRCGRGLGLLLRSMGIAQGGGGEFSRPEQALVIVCLVVGAAEIVALLLPCGLWALGAMAAASWLQYWRGYLVVSFALAWLFSLWFVAGGLRDLREFEVMLQKIDRDHSDDGSVSHNRCNDPQVVPMELVGACSGDDEPAAIELDEQGALLPSVVLKVATSRSSQKTEDTRALLCSDEEDVGHLLAERP